MLLQQYRGHCYDGDDVSAVRQLRVRARRGTDGRNHHPTAVSDLSETEVAEATLMRRYRCRPCSNASDGDMVFTLHWRRSAESPEATRCPRCGAMGEIEEL